MVKTFNKQDWSGETITINVNVSECAFNLMGSRVVLSPSDSDPKTLEVFMSGYGKLAVVVGSDEGWECYDPTNHPYYGGISRMAGDKYEAVTQYLCNVV